MMIALARPYLIGGLVALAVLIGAYQTGVNAERKRGEAAQLRVELATAQRDAAIATDAANAAEEAKAELATLNHTQEEELDALRKRLAALPEADRPRAGADALSRLYPGQ